ncbi:MAG TPA: nitrogenase component 1 [Capsulimonadaceae bacterium]|jgi:nitrogenase molybdenum-iron protein NifN
MSDKSTSSSVTTNACKLCAPLGATVAFKGIEGAMPMIHGGQGCATYIRRYLISHYNEPLDVASSSFSDEAAIFGGESNIRTGMDNVTKKYSPAMIGVSTTCLAETIGDDMNAIMKRYILAKDEPIGPVVIPVSTPSYSGTHMEGFHIAVRGVVERLAIDPTPRNGINILPGFVSTADIRYLKEVLTSFDLEYTLLPDYSDTLDGPAQCDYHAVPRGGTPIAAIAAMAGRRATVEFGRTLPPNTTAGAGLAARHDVPLCSLGMPIGIGETDLFFEAIAELSGKPVSDLHTAERGRLIDAYVDGHKYIFGKRVVVYGEEDLVVGLTSFLSEIGAIPVLCASGGTSGRLAQAVRIVAPNHTPMTREGADFGEIEELAAKLAPDFVVGNSKGYGLSRRLKIPLVRVGFPIHDRIGGQRVLHLGYRGAQRLFDEIVNSLIAKSQDDSPIGYSYM